MSKTTELKPLWEVAADAALSVEHEVNKTGYKLTRESTYKIAKAIREAIYKDNHQ